LTCAQQLFLSTPCFKFLSSQTATTDQDNRKDVFDLSMNMALTEQGILLPVVKKITNKRQINTGRMHIS
jgi:hypothetical protein